MSRRALLVGINRYPDPAHALNGCVNDVQQVRALLRQHYAFGDAALTVLIDGRATTAGIRAGLRWLVEGARAGDVLVFHYSGHGSQVPDRDGDETADGLDEIICPYDLDWDDPIADDDLHAAVRELPEGATLTVVLDCCHSGTGLREPERSGRRERCMIAPGMRVSRDAFRSRTVADTAGDLETGMRKGARPLVLPGAGEPAAPVKVHRLGRRAAEAGAVLIAGCRADQSSADALIAGAYHGALTYFLCLALAEADYRVPYSRLVRRVRASLRARGFDQDPQLEGPAALLQSLAFSPKDGRRIVIADLEFTRKAL